MGGQKSSEVEEAKKGLASAEETLTGAETEVKDGIVSEKEVVKELRKATASRAAIWTDMKEACIATDTYASELKEFSETLMPLFLKLKEREPEPEPVVEPVVEELAVEKTEEPAAEAPAAEAPATEAAAMEG